MARVSRMDGEEISTRVGQALHKGGDLLRHRLGMGPESVGLRKPAAASGKFFFPRTDAGDRAGLVRQHLFEKAAEIVREADEICRRRFHLLGYESLDYGPEIDWHLDRVHGKRAPLEPWFQIPFLEFAVVGDHKVIWELNRHQHLVTLGKAWQVTRDEKYVNELVVQWRSWVKANPYPLGINWGSTLEVAFRSLSWIWVDHLLGEAPQYREFRAELLPVLAFHGRYIERYLSTYFSPNTHLLGEAVAMFFLGTLYPQMPHSARWKQQGWKIVLREADRQVHADGVYFEQSLHYHIYAVDFFLHARQLAAANDIYIPAAFDGVLFRMLGVLQALAQAGPPEGFGDDDGGRVFNPRRNRTEHATDPLAIGTLAYNRDDLSAAELTEESIWMFGERAIATLAQERTQRTVSSAAFPEGGIYVMSDPEPFPQVMMIDAGPQGQGRCGHGHADALSLRLTMNGERWLVDAGTGVYVASTSTDRDTFRGTEAHNTLRLDGADQAVARGPFSWTDIPATRAENWLAGNTFTYFSGSHNGYQRLADGVTHRRSVLRVNGTLWLVRDVAIGRAEHNLELRWHFASDMLVQENSARELIASRPGATKPALRIILPDDSGWKTEIIRDLISPAYGCYQPAPGMRSEARVKLPAEFATVLIAQTQAQTEQPARMVRMHQAEVEIYELQNADERHSFFFARDFFAQNKQPWTFGPWSSDADLLYFRIQEEKLEQLIVIGGSSVTWQGHPLLRATEATKFFEWRRKDGLENGEPGPFTVSPRFHEMTRLSPQQSALSIQTGG